MARSTTQLDRLNCLREDLLRDEALPDKFRRITDAVVEIFNADFARIWLTRQGDRCEDTCVHAAVTEGPHVCRHRDRCLHLVASSGRYTHLDGEVHGRVPFGCYKIGRIASAEDAGFITNDVCRDPRVHDPAWASDLGLVSFAGYRLLADDGTPRGVLALFSKHRLSREDVQILEAIATTTALSVQNALVESERARAFTIIESTSDMVAQATIAGKVTYINSAGREMLGWGQDESLDRKTISDAHSPAVHEWLSSEGIPRAIEDGAGRWETTVLDPRGGEIPVSQVVMAHRASNGDLEYLSTIIRDISERKASEQELEQLRNLLSNIIDSMPSVLIGIDEDERITQWNKEAERVTGISSSDALSRDLNKMVPRLAEQIGKYSSVESRMDTIVETRVAGILEDEGDRVLDLTIYPLIANGREGAVIRLDDITDRIRLEEMMIQSEKMVSVGGLAAGMAHEINNPLSGVLQNAQVIINRIFGDLEKNRVVAQECGIDLESVAEYMERREVKEMLEAIVDAGTRAAKIVQNMLSFSRKGERSKKPHDIAGLLDDTIELVSKDYDLKKNYDFRQIEIVREYEPDLPAVPCIRSKIQQVFLNIIKNGAEAMGTGVGGKFVFKVSLADGAVVLDLANNGPWMEEETRRRAFEPFFTTKPVGVGTGLGLSVSYFIIVDDHGGTLEVDSRPDDWTRFRISLPV